MGLSSQERYSKIVWSIHRLKDHFSFLKDSEYDELKTLGAQMWAKLLGNQGNSMFWIFGGSMDGRYMSGTSLISLAFKKHSAMAAYPDNEDDEDEEDGTPYHMSMHSMKTINGMLSKDTLINDGQKGAILRINDELENIIYALNRYDDGISKSFKGLCDHIRDMQGLLFNIFQEDPDYYRVWLLSNLIGRCYNVYSTDLINSWYRKNNVHHDLRLMREHDTDELQKAYFHIQPLAHHQLDMEKRLLIMLALMGRRNHYIHRHKDLIKMLNTYNETAKDPISLEKVQAVCDWCIEQNKIFVTDRQDNYRPYCELSEQEV